MSAFQLGAGLEFCHIAIVGYIRYPDGKLGGVLGGDQNEGLLDREPVERCSRLLGGSFGIHKLIIACGGGDGGQG